MRIGELAKKTGVSVQTLRYYERRGLLRKPKRRPSGYRDYPVDAVDHLKFIKGAQEMGFSLNEVDRLLSLREARSGDCTAIRNLVRTKLDELSHEVHRLKLMQDSLGAAMRTCTSVTPARECPIISRISETTRRTRQAGFTTLQPPKR